MVKNFKKIDILDISIDPGLSKYNFVYKNLYSDINGCQN